MSEATYRNTDVTYCVALARREQFASLNFEPRPKVAKEFVETKEQDCRLRVGLSASVAKCEEVTLGCLFPINTSDNKPFETGLVLVQIDVMTAKSVLVDLVADFSR